MKNNHKLPAMKMKNSVQEQSQLTLPVCKKWCALFFLMIACNSFVFAQDNFMDVINNSKTKNFNEIVKNVETYFDKAGRGRGPRTGYKQFMRWVVFNRVNLDANGNVMDFSAEYIKAVDKARKQEEAGRVTSSFQGNWQSINGAMPFRMGRVNCIAFDPFNSNILYAGTPAGGVWRSLNGGVSWNPISDGIPSLGVSGIVVDASSPTNNRTIYILTGDGDGRVSRTVGILVSRDNGATWQNTDPAVTGPWNEYGFRLIADPTNSQIMYAATTAGIYKTTNGWASRTLVYSSGCWDLEMKPSDPNTLYAVNFAGDFLKSTAAGNSGTWATITSGLPARTNQRWAIGVTTADVNMVCFLNGAKNSTAGTYSGLYISNNSGTSFSLKSNTPNILGYDPNGLDGHTQSSWFDLAISIDNSNSNIITVAGIFPWTSTDGGSTWTQAIGTAPNVTHGDIHALEYMGNLLYCGNDGGITQSANNGKDWVDIADDIYIQQPYSISAEPSPSSGTGAKYIMGLQDNGTQKRDGATNTYIGGGDGFACEYGTNNYYYSANASTVPGALALFKKPISTLNEIKIHNEMNAFDIDNSNFSRMFVGNTNMYRSTDDGSTWTKISNNTGAATDIYYTVDISSANPDCIYASRIIGSDFRVFRTTNASAAAASVTWTDVTGTGTTALPNRRITDIEINSGNYNIAWASYGDWLSTGKVYRTANGGGAWTDITGTGLPTGPVYSLVYKNTAPRGLYAGTVIGVYFLEDGTTNWIPFKAGLPNTIVWDLDMRDNWLFAGTFGRGVWVSDLEYCPDQIDLAGTINGTKVFEADNLINSVATIGFNSNITYKAKTVKLLPSFETENSTTFKAVSAACAEAPLMARPISGIYTGYSNVATGISGNESAAEGNLAIFPNPFNSSIDVSFSIGENTHTKLSIQNIWGQEIMKLDESVYAKGNYKRQFDLSSLPSGIYFLILRTGKTTETKRVVKME